MKPTPKNLLLLAVTILGLTGYAVWNNSLGRAAPAQGRKALFYQDSMHPWIKSQQPGKCTICAMDLTPIYVGEKGFAANDRTVVLNSNSVTVLHVQVEEIKRQPLSRTLRVAGTLEANEARKAIISAPVAGRIQTLNVEFPGVEVEKGQTLLTLFSPELLQKRAYLRYVGVNSATLGNGLTQGTASGDPYSGDLIAPQPGVVVERNVYQGQYVAESERLFTLVDASLLWFRFDIYQRDLPWYELGQTLEVTVEGLPGRTFPATISFIEPTLNEATRTVKVRADIPNPVVSTNGRPQRALRFGMYAEGRVRAAIPDALAVPRSAILFPGGAGYAFVAKGAGAYESRRVTLGRQGDSSWEILQGLEEGEQVVTTGNVLIDAQAQFNQGSRPGETGAGELASAKPEDLPAAPGKVLRPSTGTMAAHAITTPGGTLTLGQQKALHDFLTEADGISRALAADSLAELEPRTSVLPKVVAALVKEFAGDYSWQEVFKRLEAAVHWPAPADLAAARKTFLPFSTSVAELVQRVRSQEESFRSLKVYHCPMAPKPGLWFQAQGPLRNPYYGAAMLECGEEVRAPAATKEMGPRKELAPAVVANATNVPKPMEEPVYTNLVTRRLAARYARDAAGDDLRARRWAAIAEAEAQRSADATRPSGNSPRQMPGAPDTGTTNTLTTSQQQALRSFIEVTDGLGQALAGDSLQRFNLHAGALSTSFALLRREFSANHPWYSAVQQAINAGLPVASAGQWMTTTNLAAARAKFLPFSTAAVDLAKVLRKENRFFAGLKIYHCPMAPQPGLWIQAKGPLRNPFYGAEMLECGKEVGL